MALAAMRNWFGKGFSLAPDQRDGGVLEVAAVVAAPDPPAGVVPRWSQARLSIADNLWGEGYQCPGGELELLRLARPLGLSGATTVLLLAAGGGGAACSLTAKTGAWVNAFEADPDLTEAAGALVARNNLGRRVEMESWDPAEPVFKKHHFHHGLALEPLAGARPEPVLAALRMALKPGAHLVMTELTADTPLDPAGPEIATWAAIARREPDSVPSEVAISRILGRLGFDVRAVEDISERHAHEAMTSWRAAARSMRGVALPRPLLEAYEREAELWTRRLRLVRSGPLRMVRWHAVAGGF